MNNSAIKEPYDKFNGDMNKYKEELAEINEANYNFYKNIFINYENNNLYFIDIMFKLKLYIFENYTKIKNGTEKDEYMKKQSIYFQNIFYDSDTTMFFDTWDSKNFSILGSNVILEDYLNYILFHLSNSIHIFTIPFYHAKNEMASKSLCYY